MRVPTATETGPVQDRARRRCKSKTKHKNSHAGWTRPRGLHTTDQANRLTGISGTATYTYNGDGLRTAKTVASVTTQQTWDSVSGSLPVIVKDGTLNIILGPSDLPLEHIDSGNVTNWYFHDQLGSTRALTDLAGAVTATRAYDAYGTVTATTGTGSTAFGYTGQYTDTETGFQYLRARHYDPATAQFLNRDPLEAMTRSPYGYVAGNPLNLTDPTGLFWGEGILKQAVTVVARGASTVIHESPVGQVLGVASRATGASIGGCINGDALGIVDITGGVCYYATPSGHDGLAISAGGGGGAPWGFGATAGPSVSNARTLSDFSGPFVYGQASFGEGPIASVQGEFGKNSCGRTIAVGTVGAGVGAQAPIPFSGSIGVVNTWTFESW